MVCCSWCTARDDRPRPAQPGRRRACEPGQDRWHCVARSVGGRSARPRCAWRLPRMSCGSIGRQGLWRQASSATRSLLTSLSVSQSASQAAAFFREVARHRLVWCVCDDQGSPAPKTSSGKRAVPYWSSRARAQRAGEIWAGGLRPVSVALEAWRTDELPELADEDYLVGINWTGPRLVGWDFTVPQVLNRLAHVLREGPYSDDSAPA